MKCNKICWTCKYMRGRYTDSFYGGSIGNCAYDSVMLGHFNESRDNMPLKSGDDICGNWAPNEYFASIDNFS